MSRRLAQLTLKLAPLALCLLLCPGVGFAVPMQTQPVELTDASGARLLVRFHGDEFFNWMSDLDGHPIERGSDGRFRYVEIDREGRWRVGLHLVGSVRPAALGLRPHPPLDRARFEASRAQRARFRAPSSSTITKGSRATKPLLPNGRLHALVIPVQFQDKALTKSRAELQALFDGPVRDYYLEASSGQVELSATVVPSLTLNQNMGAVAWNATYPSRPAWTMFQASFDYLDDQGFDFTPFDRNGDGFADLVVILHAGKGYEQTKDTSDIHSHYLAFANIPGFPERFTSHDGIDFFGYVTVPEMATSGAITPLGVVVHEAGHYFGLPDLYDTGPSANTASGLGSFCLMAYGMWTGGTPGTSPVHPSAWCKQALGWIAPQKLTAIGSQRLTPIQQAPHRVLRIDTSDSAHDADQYFLIENRRKEGFDAHLPGEGLLVFHVDEGRWSNDFALNVDPEHYFIDLEQADGRRELNTTSQRGDATDPFPTPQNAAFTPLKQPSSLAYGATDGRVFITDIRRLGRDIAFDFSLQAPLPLGARCAQDALCGSDICVGACCDENCEGVCDKVCATERTECPRPVELACDDGDPCTLDDACSDGRCVGTLKACPLPDSPCALAAFCDPVSGGCFAEFAVEGSSCEPLSRLPGDAVCAVGAATCQAGQCVHDSSRDGIGCDDGDLCTLGDACRAGRCSGTIKLCPALDECHVATSCEPSTGMCPVVPAFEETPCSGGVCRSGVCVSSAADGGGGSGCGGCQGDPLAAPMGLMGLVALAAVSVGRRRRRTG
ncbi:MAG: M6 family metalloprotease domain-containing protein [Myxococcales bacterium]|jgi:immune inhibitor A|nr:M6 family metalloprotease domain-containing protein [Myxococcales bacterium]